LKKQSNRRLPNIFPLNSVHVCSAYDIVGDIAIIRLVEKQPKHCNEVGRAIMEVHRNVKTVLAQTNAINGEFRLRKLKHIAGEKRTETIHKESGCSFNVDVATCYFSPRLSGERMRIADQVVEGETVVNMFAGVGCFSIIIAKHAKVRKIFSIDLNPSAFQFMQENIRINGFYGRIVPILGDAGQVIQERLHNVADRVLMPLPEKALDYFPYALLALKGSGGWIHYYDFVHATKAEDPVGKVKAKALARLHSLGAVVEVLIGRIVRSTGPNWYQVALDIKTNLAKQKGQERSY
jgi:tRNA (guanine37-N1)-methyltransferase